MVHTQDSLLAAYDQADLVNNGEKARRSFASLRQEIGELYNAYVLPRVVVIPVDYDPYPSHVEQFADIRQGYLKISTLHCEHPVWSPKENVKFRAIHDLIHFDCNADFTLEGEYQAYAYQRHFHRKASKAALFTEVFVQALYFTVRGNFPTQKAVTFF